MKTLHVLPALNEPFENLGALAEAEKTLAICELGAFNDSFLGALAARVPADVWQEAIQDSLEDIANRRTAELNARLKASIALVPPGHFPEDVEPEPEELA